MNILQFGVTNQTNVPNSQLAIRLSALEEQFRAIPSSGVDTQNRRGNRNMWQRLIALENRVNGGNAGSNVSWPNLNRRVRQLEIKMNRLMLRLSADNCTSNPCQNGGSCTPTFGGYFCKCSDAWTGINCEEDVNECANFAETELGCQNSIACENTMGGYK